MTYTYFGINRISKYADADENNPEAVGICDRSGFIFQHKDLHKQMEWRGNKKVWTGLLVGKPFLDTPDPQDRIPEFKIEPVPVQNPRPIIPSPGPFTTNQIITNLNSNPFQVLGGNQNVVQGDLDLQQQLADLEDNGNFIGE